MGIRINAGCGTDYREHYLNIDCDAHAAPKADMICDFRRVLRDPAAEFRRAGKRIVAAPNAILPRGMMNPAVGDSPPTDFIYVGRLVAEKKPVLLAQAFLRALSALPGETRLVVCLRGRRPPA